MRIAALVLALITGCSGGGSARTIVDAADATLDERNPRLVGLWLVEQPSHALYERTFYRLDADGTVAIGPSEPSDCSGHLERHCVTGSVARCVPTAPEEQCQGEPTCVFGLRWRSAGPRLLSVDGVCSDGVRRPIVLELTAADDATGGPATVRTVGGETGWSHDNWSWWFRRCPADATFETCAVVP